MKYFKLKDKKYDAAATAMINTIGKSRGVVGTTTLSETGTYAFNNKGGWYQLFKDEEVLDLWFEEIKEEEAEPEYKPGEWVVIDLGLACGDRNAIVKVPEPTNFQEHYTKGFSFIGVWTEKFNYGNTKKRIIRKATPQEVKDAIIKHWESIGGKFEAKVRPLDKGIKPDVWVTQGSHYRFAQPGVLYVYGFGEYMIFDGEKFAEIYKSVLPVIQGYEGKDKKGSLSWGCQSINTKDINPGSIRLVRMILANRVTQDDFDQVTKYLTETNQLKS